MRITANRAFQAVLWFVTITFVPSFQAMAQTFPPFTAPSSQQDSVQMDAGVSAAQVPNGLYGTALMSVYSHYNALYYSVSSDGLNSDYSTLASGQLPPINCDANIPGACSAAIAFYNGVIYVAYPDEDTGGLDVATATPVPGNIGYSFTLVHQDTSVYLTTTPAMAVFGSQLVIIFGARTPNVKNAFYSVNYMSNQPWPTATDEYLGANPNGLIASSSTPGLTAFNNQLWMCTQQDNSNRALFVYYSNDGVTWNFVTSSTGLYVGGGASMIVVNNNLVFANQQDNSNHALFLFSSPDGIHWTDQEYSGLRMSGPPAIALFNGNVALQYRSVNSSDMESNLVAP